MQNPLSKVIFEETLRNYFKTLKNELNPKLPNYKEILIPMEGLFLPHFL